MYFTYMNFRIKVYTIPGYCPLHIQSLYFSYNPGQNIWNKMEKFSKTEEEKKGLVSIFACFLTAIAKV